MGRWDMRILILLVVLFLLVVILAYTLFVQKGRVSPGLSIGEQFQSKTALTWHSSIQRVFKAGTKKVSPFKSYRGAKRIKLPLPKYTGIPLEDAIKNRRSARNYTDKPFTLAKLSQLLFAAQGVTGKLYGKSLRTAPSAGALYPCEIYLVVNNVQNLPQGLYHYLVEEHTLELIREGDFSTAITDAGLKQEMLGDANVTFIITAIFDRVRQKYGERGYRYTYIEAGHIGQNIALEAVSLKLGSVNVGAFFDDLVNQLVGIDGRDETTIYLQAVGSV